MQWRGQCRAVFTYLYTGEQCNGEGSAEQYKVFVAMPVYSQISLNDPVPNGSGEVLVSTVSGSYLIAKSLSRVSYDKHNYELYNMLKQEVLR